MIYRLIRAGGVLRNDGVRSLLRKSLWHLLVNHRHLTFRLFESLGVIETVAITSPDFLSQDSVTWFRFGSTETINIRDPVGVQPTPEWLRPPRASDWTVPEPLVAAVEDVTVVGRTTGARSGDLLAINKDGELLLTGETGYSPSGDASELQTRWFEKHIVGILLEYGILSGIRTLSGGEGVHPEMEFDVVCPMVGQSSLTYGHWLLNYLTKLQGIRQYVERTGTVPTLLVHQKYPSWVRRSLELLGFEDEHVVAWNGTTAHAKTLVVPSPRFKHYFDLYSEPGKSQVFPVFARSALKWVRDTMRDTAGVSETDQPTRLYVTREPASENSDFKDKRIANEKEVMEVLGPRGFERVYPPAHSLDEQVRLFSQADFVVGPFGSGLTNMAFMDDGCVLELFGDDVNPDMVGPYQYATAMACGHDYGYLVGECENGDITVDPECEL